MYYCMEERPAQENYYKWKQESVSGGVDHSVDVLNSMLLFTV